MGCQSGTYMLQEEIDKYSLLYLQFVFSYCFNVVLAYNTPIYHIFNDKAHETFVDAESYHQLAHVILCPAQFLVDKMRLGSCSPLPFIKTPTLHTFSLSTVESQMEYLS